MIYTKQHLMHVYLYVHVRVHVKTKPKPWHGHFRGRDQSRAWRAYLTQPMSYG